jgi:hypothetical protein
MTPTLFSIAMKLFQHLVCAAAIALTILTVTGCKLNPGSAHVAKATVLGLHVAPSGSGPQSPVFDLGLVRYQYVAVPAGITLTSHVDAKLGFTSQTVVEDLTAGTGVVVGMVTNTIRVLSPVPRGPQ